jgi:hypothetical protein
VKRVCCAVFFVFLCSLCFAQIRFGNSGTDPGFFGVAGKLDYAPGFNAFRPVPLADGDGELVVDEADRTIFDNSPQWVKDLRRGEIVFFGSLPFTVFFSRFFIDLARMGMNDWDSRYAPWPFRSAGGVTMTNADLVRMFSVAAAVSLTISIADHFIVKHKRKVAAETHESRATENVITEDAETDDGSITNE